MFLLHWVLQEAVLLGILFVVLLCVPGNGIVIGVHDVCVLKHPELEVPVPHVQV
jgi:hypothetical protein